ncbi:hypothetical protein OG453_05550 [Streptomyces sp. NBC_01381]|uniref:hypothetical protein n=1 Tax=unclassified Streptomyces TaxID=2593676 RepID=UPI0014332D2D|nr:MULTISPECIES: hypothetical protein [unclassified Streptomyces]MCX4666131.1 hypothetical protein [Streptomyces sp. NBC_01381]
MAESPNPVFTPEQPTVTPGLPELVLLGACGCGSGCGCGCQQGGSCQCGGGCG